MSRLGALLAVLVLALAPALPARGLMIEIPFDQLVLESDAAVEGFVVSQRSFWNADRTTIFTDTVIRVDRVVKGMPATAKQTVIRAQGGIVGDVGIRVEHQPRFQIGEEVLLFLSPETREDTRTVFSLEQGSFRLHGDRVTDYRGRTTTRDRFARTVENILSGP